MLPQGKARDHCPSVGGIMVGASRLKGRVQGDSRYVPKNIDYNRMELRKIWHDGRFSVRASESSSVVPAAELLIGQIGTRSFSLVTEAEILIGC